MGRINLYQNTARFYDGGNERKFCEDINFYMEFMKPGMKILDVGCGTGRVSLELAKLDVHITGIDYSDSMLEIFKEKLENIPKLQRDRIELFQADMTDFNLNRKFDLIIFPFRVFQALTSNEQRIACLQKVALHCHEKTEVVINMFDPNYELLEEFPKLNRKDYEYMDDELSIKVIRNTVGLEHDREKNIIYSKYVFEIIDKNDEKEIIEDFLELGYMTKEKADELFIKIGFTIENLYSWWDKSPYNSDLKRELIYVLMKEK